MTNGLRHESYGLISSGYFWPIFVMAAWGVGVVINGYTAYRGNAITEEGIEREMKTLP